MIIYNEAEGTVEGEGTVFQKASVRTAGASSNIQPSTFYMQIGVTIIPANSIFFVT
jgi:hypothetical protein